MSLHVFLSDEQFKIASAALQAAGHTAITTTKTNVTTLLTKLETEFPDLYAAIQKGVADAKDNGLSGGDKAVKVAMDVLAIAPTVITELPAIKDGMVAAVTTFFAQEISDFKNIAVTTIASLVK